MNTINFESNLSNSHLYDFLMLTPSSLNSTQRTQKNATELFRELNNTRLKLLFSPQCKQTRIQHTAKKAQKSGSYFLRHCISRLCCSNRSKRIKKNRVRENVASFRLCAPIIIFISRFPHYVYIRFRFLSDFYFKLHI